MYVPSMSTPFSPRQTVHQRPILCQSFFFSETLKRPTTYQVARLRVVRVEHTHAPTRDSQLSGYDRSDGNAQKREMGIKDVD